MISTESGEVYTLEAPDEGPFQIIFFSSSASVKTLWHFWHSSIKTEEANEWVTCLRDCAIRAREQIAKDGRSGWLSKRGKRRWFKLRNNFLMWYSSSEVYLISKLVVVVEVVLVVIEVVVIVVVVVVEVEVVIFCKRDWKIISKKWFVKKKEDIRQLKGSILLSNCEISNTTDSENSFELKTSKGEIYPFFVVGLISSKK